MSDIEKAPLAPLDARTRITEPDRSRVYDLIGKQLNDLVNGAGSYHPDSGRKSPQEIGEDIEHFKNHVSGLKGIVDDPAGILDSAIDHLGTFSKQFNSAIEGEGPKDPMVVSPNLVPNENVINPDQYPNPLDPNDTLFGARPISGARSSTGGRGIRYVSGIAEQFR